MELFAYAIALHFVAVHDKDSTFKIRLPLQTFYLHRFYINRMRRDDTGNAPTPTTTTILMPAHHTRYGYDASEAFRSPQTASCTDRGEDSDSMLNKIQHEQITNTALARFNVIASTDTSVFIESSTNLGDAANKCSGGLVHMNRNHNCNNTKPQRTPAGGMVDPCRAEYRYQRPLKSDTSVCGTDSRSVMGIMSVLVIIILGLASGVVYFRE